MCDERNNTYLRGPISRQPASRTEFRPRVQPDLHGYGSILIQFQFKERRGVAVETMGFSSIPASCLADLIQLTVL